MKATTDPHILRGKASILHLNIMQNVPKRKKDSIRPMLDEMLQIVDELCEELEKQKTKRMSIYGSMILCKHLACGLSNSLDNIMKELDRLDGIQLTEPAPAAEPTEAQLCDLKEKVRDLQESFDKRYSTSERRN